MAYRLPDTDALSQGYASSTRPVGDEGGPTNPRLLQEPAVQMAATMYRVSAMKRFAKLSEAQVYQVVGEMPTKTPLRFMMQIWTKYSSENSLFPLGYNRIFG